MTYLKLTKSIVQRCKDTIVDTKGSWGLTGAKRGHLLYFLFPNPNLSLGGGDEHIKRKAVPEKGVGLEWWQGNYFEGY